MRLAEPETLQNTYKPHKCCIKRLFCFLKLFFFSLVPNMLVPQIIRLRQRARVHRIEILTATQGQTKKERSGCQIVMFFTAIFVFALWNTVQCPTHAYQSFVPTRVSKKARTEKICQMPHRYQPPARSERFFSSLTIKINKYNRHHTNWLVAQDKLCWPPDDIKKWEIMKREFKWREIRFFKKIRWMNK